MKLQFVAQEYSVCQLSPGEAIPAWANWNDNSDFISISQTEDELTVITQSARVPEGTKKQSNFACMRVTGNLEFDVIGVIAGISSVLAQEKIPILSISTYNTDYFLIPKSKADLAISSLKTAGYEFE